MTNEADSDLVSIEEAKKILDVSIDFIIRKVKDSKLINKLLIFIIQKTRSPNGDSPVPSFIFIVKRQPNSLQGLAPISFRRTLPEVN